MKIHSHRYITKSCTRMSYLSPYVYYAIGTLSRTLIGEKMDNYSIHLYICELGVLSSVFNYKPVLISFIYILIFTNFVFKQCLTDWFPSRTKLLAGVKSTIKERKKPLAREKSLP